MKPNVTGVTQFMLLEKMLECLNNNYCIAPESEAHREIAAVVERDSVDDELV